MKTSSGCWRRTTTIDLWPFFCLYFLCLLICMFLVQLFKTYSCFSPSSSSSFALGFHLPRCTNSKTDKVRTRASAEQAMYSQCLSFDGLVKKRPTQECTQDCPRVYFLNPILESELCTCLSFVGLLKKLSNYRVYSILF